MTTIEKARALLAQSADKRVRIEEHDLLAALCHELEAANRRGEQTARERDAATARTRADSDELAALWRQVDAEQLRVDVAHAARTTTRHYYETRAEVARLCESLCRMIGHPEYEEQQGDVASMDGDGLCAMISSQSAAIWDLKCEVERLWAAMPNYDVLRTIRIAVFKVGFVPTFEDRSAVGAWLARLDAARAETIGGAIGSGWRPISEAPDDGTLVIVTDGHDLAFARRVHGRVLDAPVSDAFTPTHFCAAPRLDAARTETATCEGCAATPTGHDVDGVPLCDACGTEAAKEGGE